MTYGKNISYISPFCSLKNYKSNMCSGRDMNIYYKFEYRITISLFIFINRDVNAYVEITIYQSDPEFLLSRVLLAWWSQGTMTYHFPLG